MIAVLVAIGAGAIVFWQPEVGSYVDAGLEAPAFTLSSLPDDAPVALADSRGKVVLLNFWATWCKPCEDEMPSMERLYRRVGRERFELLAISVDESRDLVAAFRERYRLTFPILLDPHKDVADAYQTYRFPESFLIDAEGRVVERYIGPRDWDSPEYAGRIGELVSVLP